MNFAYTLVQREDAASAVPFQWFPRAAVILWRSVWMMLNSPPSMPLERIARVPRGKGGRQTIGSAIKAIASDTAE